MLQEASKPFLTYTSETILNVGVNNPAHLSAVDPRAQGVKRIVWSASGSKPIRESEEVFLVDAVEHHDSGALDYLIFQGGDRQWPLFSVRLRYVRPAGRLRPIRSSSDPSVQIYEPWLEVYLVVLPRHAIHPRSGLALERVERLSECVDRDMVQERGELLSLPLPCGLPYAVQRLGHTFPALCPECALLLRVPLGPRPSLHRLRRRLAG
jgi:hypothetical protein